MNDFLETKKMMINCLDKSINMSLDNLEMQPYCKKGCSECCSYVIPISLFDLKYLLIGLNKLREDKKSIYLEKQLDKNYKNKDLDEKTCINN